jgi:hypothetical protein
VVGSYSRDCGTVKEMLRSREKSPDILKKGHLQSTEYQDSDPPFCLLSDLTRTVPIESDGELASQLNNNITLN